ncbi:hypothetical protein Lfu02_79110 [Longispora fulva]|nr:hypothetical protein Lfu02_79110 [Longispora fulva]
MASNGTADRSGLPDVNHSSQVVPAATTTASPNHSASCTPNDNLGADGPADFLRANIMIEV